MNRSILIVAAAVCFVALPGTSSGQNQVPDQGRSTPAAWRPSFSGSGTVQTPQAASSQASQSQGSASQGSATQGSSSQGSQSFPSSNPANSGLQAPVNPLASTGSTNRASATGPNASLASNRSLVPQPNSASRTIRPGVTRVTRTFEKLPNSSGQVWREYDITPYTSELTSLERPEQAVIEWILKETGTKLWFGEPMGVLSADRKRVVVYHTPEIQKVCKTIIDRFNRTRAQAQVFEVNLMTIDNPNWRATAYPMLQPVDLRSPGIEAWLVSKENAAILQSQLSRRGDFKRHSGGRVANPDGQTFVMEKSTPVSFVQALQWTPDQIPNYQPKTQTINEGYRLALSCLTSLDNRSIEVIVDCDVDQVESLTPVKVDLPAPGGVLTQLDLNVPQLVSWRVNERVRWPSDQVLLLSAGIVVSPEAKQDTRGGFRLLSRKQAAKRTNSLLFIEFRGPQSGATVAEAARNSGDLKPISRR